MAVKMLPKDVADAFVRQYYIILNKCPENVYKFYQELSFLGWPGPDGVVTPVTTLSEINNKIMASDHKDGIVEVETVDAQQSLEGAVIVAVTGYVTSKDDVKKYFSQTFFLAKQDKGFFVLNDILRVLDLPSSTINDEVDNASQNSDANLDVENIKVKEVEPPVVNDTAPNCPIPKSPVSSPKKPPPVSTQLKSSVVTMATPKISYASMVAKERPPVSPKPSVVTPNSPNQTKPLTPRSTGSAKVSPLKQSTSPTKPLSKSPRAGNVAPNATTNDETRGIYIGRLPYNVTKQGIIDVVKQFGPVKRYPDSVQIIRHEDGFCCGFVEFESAESARRAVEAHHIRLSDKDISYVSYKRSNRGNGGGRRSPTRAGVQSHFRGRERETPRRGGGVGRQLSRPSSN